MVRVQSTHKRGDRRSREDTEEGQEGRDCGLPLEEVGGVCMSYSTSFYEQVQRGNV